MKHLIATFKAGNGRRGDTTYAIEDDVANDPIQRAAKISEIQAGTDKRLVNWRIVEVPK